MSETIELSPEIYQLLRRQAETTQSTPQQVAEAAIRLQFGNSAHIEQRRTRSGLQAYVRGTRVAVRHIAAFLKAGHTVEEIIEEGVPQLSPAAVYEAIAYYYDHQAEIEAELEANQPEAVYAKLRERLSPEQFAELTGQQA
jgi:uncharacterized protein (DUF433 family)